MIGLMLFHLGACSVLIGLALQAWANRRAALRLEAPTGPVLGRRVSVLIPARNEAAKIERCLHAWTDQTYPNYEVLVYDDDSCDDTAARAATVGAGRVQVVRGGPLPSGWRGKQHACHCLRAHASGELLVFADADVTVMPGALAATVNALTRLGVRVLSAVPRHTSPHLLVRASVAIQNFAAQTLVPSWRRAAPMFAALNGQFLAVRADVYDAVGGFAAVRATVADDVAFGRLLAAHNERAPLLDGAQLLVCEPYDNLHEAWWANVRSLVPIFFGSAALLLTAMLLLAALYLIPFALLAVGLAGGKSGSLLWTWLPLIEVGLGLLTRRSVDARVGYPWPVTLLHPIAVTELVAMAVGSVIAHRVRHSAEWRGRRYALKGPPGAPLLPRTSQRAGHGKARRLTIFLTVLGAVALLAYAKRASVIAAAGLIPQVSLGWLLGAAVAIAGVYVCRAGVYRAGLRTLGHTLDYPFLWGCALVATSLHQLIPAAGATGYVYLTYAFHRRGVATGGSSMVALLDTLSNALSVATLLLITVVYLGGSLSPRSFLSASLSGVIVVGAALYLYYRQRDRVAFTRSVLALSARLARLLRRRWREAPLRDFLDHYYEAKEIFQRRPAALLVMVSLQYVALACDCLALWMVLHALRVSPRLWVVFLSLVVSMAGLAVATVPAGGGSFEVLMSGFLAANGTPLATAIAAAVLYRTVAFWLPLGASVPVVLYQRRRATTSAATNSVAGGRPGSLRAPPPTSA
jgi:uncharacterized protein (TIRG00374 family)